MYIIQYIKFFFKYFGEHCKNLNISIKQQIANDQLAKKINNIRVRIDSTKADREALDLYKTIIENKPKGEYLSSDDLKSIFEVINKNKNGK